MPEFSVDDVIIQFAVIVAAALVVQLAFERTRVPGLIGLIILGMLIGPGGAAILPDEPVVELFGSIGLLYIMFIAGVEIDIDQVKDRKVEAASFGAMAFVFTFISAFAVGLLFELDIWGALLLGAALSSHTLVAYPMVSQLGLAERRPIVAVTGGTLLTDTAALLVLVVIIRAAEGDGGWSWMVPMVSLAVLAGASLYLIPRLARAVLSHELHTFPEKALFVMTILLVLSVLADLIGTEDILGAFLAGVCLNTALHRREDLKQHIEFVGRMLFLPFFFVDTGMRLHLDALQELSTWFLAAILITVIIVTKGVSAAVTARLFGYSKLGGLAIASLSFPQAAATLAVVVIGLEMDLVDPVTADAVIIVIFVTCLLGSLLTHYSANRMAGDK